MRVFNALAALLGVHVVSAKPLRIHSPNAVAADPVSEASSDFVPGAYIVEFTDDNDTPANFYDALAAEGVDVEARMELRFRLFKGLSFQVRNLNSSAQDVHNQAHFMRRMQEAPRVKNIWPVRTIKLDMSRDAGSPVDAPASFAPGAYSKRKNAPADKLSRTFSPHVMTQVDKLHEKGLTGKGFRIAIIDSGIDWSHPALGGCFGPGCLVEAGYDFVGDDFLPGARPAVPDPDPQDNCVGHGTHVAGTIAAQLEGNEYGFTGSAPGAKLMGYRVWGCSATSTDEILMAGFNRAVEDGADIISYSNGDPSGWTSHAWGVFASRIVDSGIPVIVSEGNDGGQGLFYASMPATGRRITGTGAVTNSIFPTFLKAGSYSVDPNDTNSSSSTKEFRFLTGFPSFANDVKLRLWSAVGADNACKELPADTPDLHDRIVLLRDVDSRATQCYPQDQGANIAARGGRFMMYIAQDNTTMRDDKFVYAQGIEGVAKVAPHQGEEWRSLLEVERQVILSITNTNASKDVLEELENNISGSYMGDLSSWGPTWELNATPQLAAPGANILSTYPVALGGYRVMTGTSMATPLVAGIYALLGELHGKLEPQRLRTLLTTTSKPLVWFDGKTAHADILAPVPQQGGGIVQAFSAASTPAEVSIDSISFNDTDHFIGNQTFSVRNVGTTDILLSLGHRKAATMYSMIPNADILRASSFPNPVVEEYAELSFSVSTLSIPAGGSADVTVICTPPPNLNDTLLPVYSGYITLTESANLSSLAIPYLGVRGSMRDTPVLQATQVYLANYNNAVPPNHNYTIPRPDPANPPRTDRGDESKTPNVLISPTVGTSIMRIDVIRVVGSQEDVLGDLAGWPMQYTARDSRRAFFNGLLADATVIEEGSYILKVSALRVFGQEAEEGDWDVIRTVPFSFAYN